MGRRGFSAPLPLFPAAAAAAEVILYLKAQRETILKGSKINVRRIMAKLKKFQFS